MELNASSQFLANSAGTIETIHPPGQNPVIGMGVGFNPARSDRTVMLSDEFQSCPTP